MSSISFKPIVQASNKRKDGTIPLKIRVTYKGVVRRLPTNLVCQPKDLTRNLHIKSADIIDKANRLISQMRGALADLSPYDLEGRDVDWVVNRIKSKMTEKRFQLDFFVWAKEYTLTKSESTRVAYTAALNALERFIGKRELDINDISRTMLLDFVDFVEKEPVMHYDHKTKTMVPTSRAKTPIATPARYITKLGNIFKAAKDRYNDEDSSTILIPRSPFDKIRFDVPLSKGQASIGREAMQMMINSQVDSKPMRVTLDLFLLSFCLMGANMADLYMAKPFKGDVWVYNRQKTASRRADNAEHRVTIPECAKPIIERLRGKGGWWLNELHEYASKLPYANRRASEYLKRWARDNGLEEFTFYAARHTWATIGRQDCKIEKATIDDCLAHKGDYSITDIYAEKAWNLMDEANAKVLSLFDWD